MSYFLKHVLSLFLFRGIQTIPHSKKLTTITMIQNGEAKFKETPAEEGPPLVMICLLPLGALVLLDSIVIYLYCRIKRKNVFIYLIFLLPNMRKYKLF